MRNLPQQLVAVGTLITFIGGQLPRTARAEASSDAPQKATESVTTAHEHEVDAKPIDPQSVAHDIVRAPVDVMPMQTLSLPTGSDKSGVTSQAISVPQGAGKIQGMGESFSAQLSTGIGTYSVPFSLPTARGAAQPSLGLSYSSSMGHGLAGVGWDVGVPFIARQVDRGIPTYDDPTTGGDFKATQDRFVFNGGQELVPICLVNNSLACSGALSGEVMPVWASGYMYFRARVEGAFLRFFWSPDHQTWRVQDKSGTSMELGVPLDDSTYVDGLERDENNTAHVFRWNLVRQYDANGNANPSNGAPTPNNLVVYRWSVVAGTGYLTNIYDTPPATNTTSASLDAFAHHTRLSYEDRSDPTVSYRRGYETDQTQRLTRVDVASKTFEGSGARVMVRRYELAYDPNFHPSLLTSVQLEGQCTTVTSEDANENISYPTNCPKLPPLTFGYQHVAGYTVNNTPQPPDLVGYEAFDERLTSIANSPNHSINESLTDLFDINADGLPDVLVTDPGLYSGNHGVFFAGAGGTADKFDNVTMMAVNGVLGANAGVISLDNVNVSEHDVDGDGIANLLHMPQLKQYAVYTPTYSNGGWAWDGRVISTASTQNVKVDFQNNRADIKVMDVNGDGLVDVVYSSATEYDTYLSLGRYPNGDGQYGYASWAGPTSANISNDPLTACAEYSGSPVRLSDDDVRIGDMNGDGLPDIVRIRKGDIRYWPGRGNGFWGTGAIDDCLAGTYGSGREIAMTNSPYYSDPSLTEVRLDDVNGDGLDDIVQIRYNDVDVWLNVDGTSFTPSRHTMASSPATPLLNIGRARLVDINGSGTRDVVWGNGSNYQYADFSGGNRPWVLTHVDNGLGKTTDISYATSTAQMLAAAAAGNPWTRTAPIVAHVVSNVVEHDNLGVVGRPNGVYTTTYVYRDPDYDGRQREFRGFAMTTVTRSGDVNSPTSTTQSTFLLGDCKNETQTDVCSLDELWNDNPREALKGLPVLSETFDQNGNYLSTTHNTYRLRQLYTGLDGRVVRHAFHEATDAYIYDVSGNATSTTLTDVNLETTLGSPITDTTSSVTIRGTRAHIQSSSTVDPFGNATAAASAGCVDGCQAVDETITTTTTPGRRNDDPTGWMYRTTETYTVGSSNPTDERQHHFMSYDVDGNLLQTTAALSGTLALDRFHESNKAIAPAPPNASADRTITLSTQEYDAFGNTTTQTAPNFRCRSLEYDAPYGQFVTTESVYVGAQDGVCGNVTLQASASYDRGFAIATDVFDIHNEYTKVQYDGFGRLVELFKPDPDHVMTASAVPSVKIEYLLTSSPSSQPYSMLHTQTQDGADASTNSYRDVWAYVDGLDRTIVTLDQADPQSGDSGAWVVNGLTDYDQKGAVEHVYLAWFWTGAPTSFPLNTYPASKSTRERYDAFGRLVERYNLDGSLALRNSYHALSQDSYDAADLGVGPHSGTYATSTKDGHGRVTTMIERIHAGQQIEQRAITTQYLPTSEPLVITRQRGTDSVTRWLRYDSLGRMVLNAEPSTTSNFSPDPSTDASTMQSWRYAYDDNGEIVGTSDARGCGANYHYDTGGRLIAEDYSPCLDSQPAYSAPDFTSLSGLEVYYFYDYADPDTPTINGFSQDASLLLGRLVSASDRASKTITSFDGRGRVTGLARRIAKPGVPDDALTSRYAPRWYVQTAAFDGADRVVSQSSGAQVTELLGANSQSIVTTNYTKRGIVKDVGSSYGSLITHIFHDADGLPTELQYGDLAQTTTDFTHDDRRRLQTVQTYRGPPTVWTSPPTNYTPAPDYGTTSLSSFQTVLENTEFTYDEVDNPTEVHDWRSEGEWPAGSKPATRKASYDDLYRLTSLTYQYSAGDDAWVDPFDAEDQGIDTDPRHAKPSPHVSFDKRILAQSYQYDWLGNIIQSTDDEAGFYDRSLGIISHSTTKRYQVTSATGTTSTRDGSLTVAYDASGNTISIAVTRAGNCVPTNATCSHRLVYDWDEVGHLARARRWDLASPGNAADALPTTSPNADLSYGYDAGDERRIKTATDETNTQAQTLYVFASLELRRTTFEGGDYDDTKSSEVPYLFAQGIRLARLHYSDSSLPTLTSGHRHVLFELPDYLSSTSSIIDRDTGELVEAARYQAYGSVDADYRPSRWDSFREDYQFTGKEDDVEVGITYFGKRFLSTSLGSWLSPDPLALHSLGADLNLYAYVRASVLRAIDPFGLDDNKTSTVSQIVNYAADRFVAAGEAIAGPGADIAARFIHKDAGAIAKIPEAELKYSVPYMLVNASASALGAAFSVPHDVQAVVAAPNSVERAERTVDLSFAIFTLAMTALGAGELDSLGGRSAVPTTPDLTQVTPKAVTDGAAGQKVVGGENAQSGSPPPPNGGPSSAAPTTSTPLKSGTVVRGGQLKPQNLTPRVKNDLTPPNSGLSTFKSWDDLAADVLKRGGGLPKRYLVIDVSKLTSLQAFADASPTGHVSIRPADPKTLFEWASSRGGTTVHPLTTEVHSAVTLFDQKPPTTK